MELVGLEGLILERVVDYSGNVKLGLGLLLTQNVYMTGPIKVILYNLLGFFSGVGVFGLVASVIIGQVPLVA